MPRAASTVKAGESLLGEAEEIADRLDRARRASRLLRLAAQPTRLQVLLLLGDGELHVGAITDAAANSQPAASHHLAVLRRGGLIARWRRGRTNCYRLTEPGAVLAEVMSAIVSRFGAASHGEGPPARHRRKG